MHVIIIIIVIIINVKIIVTLSKKCCRGTVKKCIKHVSSKNSFNVFQNQLTLDTIQQS